MKRQLEVAEDWPARGYRASVPVISMREDHRDRPLLLAPDRKVFLYTGSRLYRVAYEFLVCVAEPIFRPVFVQEYQVTRYSLYSAMVLNFSTEDILLVLAKLMKNTEIPASVQKYIQTHTQYYGGARLQL
jgi:DNA excision repair protein ERCC-3